jgi:type IV pilus assembly protein PilA
MKPDLQAKFLQHLNTKRKSDEGFTLIELLVVIIIIGILAAIALPSLLGQVNKARQAEAKNNIGTMNRAQQAYQLEFSEFASDIGLLGVGLRTQTENYNYDIAGDTAGVILNRATSRKVTLKSYYGAVGTLLTTAGAATSEVVTIAMACESIDPTITEFPEGSAPTPTEVDGGTCGADYKSLGG